MTEIPPLQPQSAKMSSMLEKYRDILEKEREATLRQQFLDFLEKMEVSDTDRVESLYGDFQLFMNNIENDDTALQDRVTSAIQSEFLYRIMTLKNSSRERELRKITHELSSFIEKAAHNAESEQQFMRNLLSNSLRAVADEIEPKKGRQPGQSMHEAWADAMRLGLELFQQTQKY